MRYSKEQDKSVELCGTIIVTFPAWGVGIFFILGFFTDPLFPIRLPVSIIVAAVISFYMYSTSYYKKWWDAFEKASPEERMRMEEERFQEEERRKKEEEEAEKKRAEERKEAEKRRAEEAKKEEEELEKEERAWYLEASRYFTSAEIAVLDESCWTPSRSWTLRQKKAKLESRKRHHEKRRFNTVN